MTIIDALVELQEVDGRIRELELELKDLPRRKALETARLSGVSADLQAAKAGEDNLIEDYLNDTTKNIDVNKVCFPFLSLSFPSFTFLSFFSSFSYTGRLSWLHCPPLGLRLRLPNHC